MVKYMFKLLMSARVEHFSAFVGAEREPRLWRYLQQSSSCAFRSDKIFNRMLETALWDIANHHATGNCIASTLAVPRSAGNR